MKVISRQWSVVSTSVFYCAFSTLLFALCLSAEAQQPTRTAHIGFLTTVPFSAITDRTEAFREGLRALGYVEGKTIVIEWRSAEGKQDRLPALASELVRLNLDVIVTGGSPVTRALKGHRLHVPGQVSVLVQNLDRLWDMKRCHKVTYGAANG